MAPMSWEPPLKSTCRREGGGGLEARKPFGGKCHKKKDDAGVGLRDPWGRQTHVVAGKTQGPDVGMGAAP